MGGNKRKSAERAAEASPASKKNKSPKEEFTGTSFKAQLKDPKEAMRALEKFISVSRKLPCEELYDVVEGYVKISMECAEIFKLLDGEKRPEIEMLLIFQTLEAILLRTASDLSHFTVVGLNIVKRIIDSYMKLLYASLYSESHRMARVSLNFMSAMVTQGPDSARDFFGHFDFHNKFLTALLKKRNKEGRPDVRMAYIQFAVSFLIAGDRSTIVQLLELKDFIQEIFNTGIKEDRISTINLLLSSLETKVVRNKAISKTQKVRFFTSGMLNRITSLYRWKGIVDVSTDDVKDVQPPGEEGKVLVRGLVHNFLMDLCCSLTHGINFYDPSLGTAGRAGNLVLLRFVVGLKIATEDELVAELVVNILKVCPDLLSRYFKETQYSFAPRLKSVWLDNIKLLKKIYEAQPEISSAFRTTEFIPLSRLLSMVMITTVPPVCNKTMFTQGINFQNQIVQHTTLSLLSAILKRAQKTIDHCLNEDLWQKSEIYSPAVMEEFTQKYREALSKLLPDINSIVFTWNSLSKHGKKGQGEQNRVAEAIGAEKKAIEVPEIDGQFDTSGEAETTLLKANILFTICLYQKVVPHLVAQSNFDFSKLLKGIVNEKGMQEEMPPILQYNILQVALELPANKFTWFKAQNAENVFAEKSVFGLLLKMFVTSNNSQLKTSTKLLIVKILRDSGVFEYTWRELDLWLDHLDNIEGDQKKKVITFLEKILMKLVSNPYPYTDKAADVVHEASVLQVNENQHDSDSVSVPISHIDDVLDMVDVIVEGSEGLDEEIGFSLNDDLILNTFPFSALVPASLEFRNTLLFQGDAEMGSVLTYLGAVMTDILHSQRDPLALCLLLQTCDKELTSLNMKLPLYSPICQFNIYYSRWIPKQVKETLIKQPRESCIDLNISEKCSFASLLKNAYESQMDLLLEDNTKGLLREAISQLKLCDLLLASKQVMLYLRTTVDNFSKLSRGPGSALVCFFLDLLYLLVCRCDQVKTEQQTGGDQTASDLFEDSACAAVEPAKTELLQDMLRAIMKHPVLENWFLALEGQTLPPHSLNPVTVKLLSSHMNSGIIKVLKLSAPMLENIGQLSILSKYFEAVAQCILKELDAVQTVRKKMPDKISNPLMALQELHQYMDATLLKEVTLAMLVVGKRTSETTEGTHLSFYGETLVQLLTQCYQRQPTKGELVISAEHIKGLGILLSTSSSEELANVLFYALQKEPVFTHVIAVDVLLYCLNHMTEVCLSIGALLVQHSRPHLFQFELWCLTEGRAKHLRKNMDAYLPLINAYLACAEQYSFSRPLQVSSAALRVLREAFWKKLINLTLISAVNEVTSLQLTVLSKLIPASHEEELTIVIEQLPDVLAQPGNLESWVVADAVSTALKNSVEQTEAWKKTLLSVCMKSLATSYSHDKDQEKMQDKEASILARLEELLNSVKEVVTVEWNTFVKMGLKYRYNDCKFQRVVKVAIDLLYKDDSPGSKTLIPLPMVHMMITQHSLFLPSILRSREEEPTDSHPLREALVDVLRAIVEKCPSVCDSNHFAVFLGAYSATLSVTDQKILLLLQMYEQNNLSLTDFRLLLWGPAAVEHHKTRKSLGKSLWQQPSTEEILSLLDRERVSRTITNFPQHRHLHPKEGLGMMHKDEHVKEMHDLYDPAFLLPLFCELVRPEFVVDCQKFVEVNALGLTMASLSSYDSNMRAAAYYVLGYFYSHLEGARFRDKRQLLYLMDVVKNGIRQENLRLTFSLTLYIAKSALQCLKPEDHMYIKINRFLLMHQYLDLKKVPDFYKLFYSFDFEHKVEREWILQLLAEGLQDKYCYELYDYQSIFQVIMSYFNSPLCDEFSQNQIFEILHRAALVLRAAYELIRDHSLLTWILHILAKRFLDNKRLTNIITLLDHLWQTVLGDRNTEKSTPLEKQNLFPLQMVNEFLHVFIALIQHIPTNLAVVHLSQFFSTLNSILTYRVTVMKAFKEMGRFTLNESIFSNKDILMLLHKWSIIEKDTELQGDLNALAQKYKVKELIRTIKEKNKPQALGWLSSRQTRKRMEVDLEEQVHERKQDFNLENEREHMTSILLHWVPVFLDLSIKPPVEQVGLEEPQDATNGLVCTTAYIIVKWVFSSMATYNVSWHDLSGALQWLNTHVLSHAAVTEEILRDGVLKRVLCKLYNRVNDASFMVTLDFDVLHLFNKVMIQQLDAQGIQEPSFHRAVKEFCRLAETEEDEEKKAAVVFLVSTYIADMWLGASEPEKFVAHLKAICDSTNEKITDRPDRTPKRKRQKEAEEAIISACKEIAAAALV